MNNSLSKLVYFISNFLLKITESHIWDGFGSDLEWLDIWTETSIWQLPTVFFSDFLLNLEKSCHVLTDYFFYIWFNTEFDPNIQIPKYLLIFPQLSTMKMCECTLF